MQLFDIAMEITVETAADGTDEYAVTTTDECPAVSVVPLKADQTAARLGVQNLNDSGDFYPGRGLVWGLRALSPNWQGVWRGEARISNLEKQIIFMMVGTIPQHPETNAQWKVWMEQSNRDKDILIIFSTTEAYKMNQSDGKLV